MGKIALPAVLGGVRIKVATGCGSMYIHLSWYQGKLVEVFATLGRGGGCAACEMEALTRTVSIGLRSDVPLGEYVSQLRGIRCPTPMPFPKETSVLSCPDAIAETLRTYGSLTIDKVIELFHSVDGRSVCGPPPVNPSAPPAGVGEELSEGEVAAQVGELARQREDQGLYT